VTEKTITLRGPWALIVLVLIGLFTVYQYSDRNRTLESDAVEVIKTWLVAEYVRNALPQLQELVNNPEGKENQVEALVKNISRDRVQIVSIQARGNSDDVAVQVEIEVDDKDPPDGKRVRYFRMSHSALIGWQYEHEISKWGYYLSF
jgi:hypothetical protein